MFSWIFIKLIVLFLLVQNVMLMAALQRPSYFSTDDSNSDLEEYLKSKSYIPSENNLPRVPSAAPFSVTDSSYILSKLKDEDLLNLLKEQPNKNDYGLDDIIKVGVRSENPKFFIKDKLDYQNKGGKLSQNNGFSKINIGNAVFRLKNREVKNEINDQKYPAVKKITELLSKKGHEWYNDENSEVVDENKKEMLFDILVAELKSLCCGNKHKTKLSNPVDKLKSFMNTLSGDDLRPMPSKLNENVPKTVSEHIFLVINDDIKNVGSDELMLVDPESLEKNSSVLLLGPITTPLTDDQLKLAMNRIANEISKPEYLPLLRQLSVGELNNHNNLRKSFITGPETRRYIKPHRCNYQSKLAKVYGGPRWIICTGYINLNTPSLYD